MSMYLVDKINFIKGKRAAGIHLILKPDGSWNMNIAILYNNKDKVQIEKSCSEVELSEKITTIVPNNIPICLSLEGKGVIHRKITNGNISDPLNQILPNAKVTDFMIQSQIIDSGYSLISLIRFDLLNEILHFFNEKGYLVCKLFLGPFSLNNLWPLIIDNTDQCLAQGYKIKHTNDAISDIEYIGYSTGSKEFSILGESIATSNTVPYSNALSYFVKIKDHTLTQLGSFPALRYEDFIFKRSFQMVAVGFVAILFISLLINFLLFTSYNEKLSTVSTKYRSGLELINHLEKLKNEFNLREKMVKENGLFEGTHLSHFADRLAALVPRQISLTRMEINPVSAKPKLEKEILFNKNSLKISGKCTYSTVLNEWMEILKQEKWISRMEVLQYKQEDSGIPGEFILLLEFQ